MAPCPPNGLRPIPAQGVPELCPSVRGKPPEQSVPDDSEAAHFGTLEAARTYARSLGAQCGGRVVVERRSAGGCWLCLAELG